MPAPAESQGIQVISDWDTWVEKVGGSPAVDAMPDGTRSLKHVLVTGGFEMALEIQQQLLGYPYLHDDGTLRRKLPEADWVVTNPDLEMRTYCVSARLRPFAGDGKQLDTYALPVSGYSHYLIEAAFSSLPYSVALLDDIVQEPKEAQRFTRVEPEQGGEFATSEHGDWEFDIPGVDLGKSTPAGLKVGFWIPEDRLTVTWFDVPREFYTKSVVDDVIGKTNDSDIRIDGKLYPAETLLLLNALPIPKNSALSQPIYEVKYIFLHKPLGVRKFLHPGPGGNLYNLRSPRDAAKQPIDVADYARLWTMDV